MATVDPVQADVDYRSVKDVPLERFEGALVCVPDDAKLEILSYLLGHGKHVLVEKPLLAESPSAIAALAELARRRGVVCYTAYNHRFEPHFVRMKELIESERLGRIYLARLFYGNGTARDVRDSVWRDKGAGVLPDLGSHLLDTVLFWFGDPGPDFRIFGARSFENRACDHVSFGSEGTPVVELATTLLSWRNHFTADVFAEKGTAHIESLCKWGPSHFIVRERALPSGRPREETITLVQPDPTWELEYAHWKGLCLGGGQGNLDNDAWIERQLRQLGTAAFGQDPR